MLISLCVMDAWSQRSDRDMAGSAAKIEAQKTEKQRQLERNKKLERMLRKKSEEGGPGGMFEYGSFLMKHSRTLTDSLAALTYIERASNAGYVHANMTMGKLHKMGLLVSYDLHRAYEYFDRSANGPYRDAFYFRGYMRYKGLGCRQDYKAAFDDFESCARYDDARCMYMLGLCYRNGFGVAEDRDLAKSWLDKAAQKGFTTAEKELSILNPELDPGVLEQLRKNRSASLIVDNPGLKANEFNTLWDITEALTGEVHEGYWVRYDWSGQHILSVEEVRLTCRDDEGLDCKLVFDKNKREIGFKAERAAGNVLSLRDLVLDRNDRYIDFEEDKLLISDLGLKMYTDEDHEAVIIGDVTAFSTFQKEPERPVKIFLRRGSGSTGDSRESITEASVSPNPFSGRCNISLKLQAASDCVISISDINGKTVYQSARTRLQKGAYVFPLEIELLPGTYFVSLACGEDHQTIKLIKL